MERLPSAIVLGCHKAGLGIIRALGEAQVPVVSVYYNKMDMGYVSRHTVAHYHSPHPASDENGFVELLVNLSSKWMGGVLIPSDDATLVTVSRHKAYLERYYKVLATPWEITEKYIAKKHTYSLAERIGVLAPKTVVPGDFKEAEEFVKTIGFPCLLKPSVGHGFYELFRKKMILAGNIAELERAWKTTADAGTDMMIQEYIPGDDASGANYNSFIVRGAPLIEATAQKVRLSPPRTGFPRVVVSRYIPELLEPGRKMLQALGYEGFSCTEFKKDARDGIYKLMEVNGRLNLSSPLSAKCGLNFAYLAYLHAIGAELPHAALTVREEVYWIDVGKDIAESIKNCGREKFSLREYVLPYLKPHVFTVFSLNDPLPFIKRSYDIVKALPKLIVNKIASNHFFRGAR